MVFLLSSFVLASMNSSSYEEAIKELGQFPGIYEYKDKANEIGLFGHSMENNENKYHKNLLFQIESDIEKFKKMSYNDKLKFQSIIDYLKKIKSIELGKGKQSDLYFAEDSSEFVKRFFGKESYTDLIVTIEIAVFKVAHFEELDWERMIESELERFQNSSWKSSPEISSFYIVKCANLRQMKKFKDLYKASQELNLLRLKITKNPESTVFIGPAAYEFEALRGLKRHNEVLERFKKIPDKLLETESRHYLEGISMIYSCVATSYFENKKFDLACIYQEMALAKAYSCYENRNNPSFLREAVKLQSYFTKTGNFKQLHDLEERYNLKPLPKNPAEK